MQLSNPVQCPHVFVDSLNLKLWLKTLSYWSAECWNQQLLIVNNYYFQITVTECINSQCLHLSLVTLQENRKLSVSLIDVSPHLPSPGSKPEVPLLWGIATWLGSHNPKLTFAVHLVPFKGANRLYRHLSNPQSCGPSPLSRIDFFNSNLIRLLHYCSAQGVGRDSGQKSGNKEENYRAACHGSPERRNFPSEEWSTFGWGSISWNKLPDLKVKSRCQSKGS